MVWALNFMNFTTDAWALDWLSSVREGGGGGYGALNGIQFSVLTSKTSFFAIFVRLWHGRGQS